MPQPSSFLFPLMNQPRGCPTLRDCWRVVQRDGACSGVVLSMAGYGFLSTILGLYSKLILSHYSYAVMFLPPREKPRGVGHPQRGTLFGHSVLRVIAATCAALQTAPTVLPGSDLKRRNSTCRLASTR